MKKLLGIIFLLCALPATPAWATLNVFACEPEWAALAQELGGDKLTIFTATDAMQDPHFIQARPSLVARLRQADLALCTGAELETGWLPVLQRQAGNEKVQEGQPGYFEAAAVVDKLDVPTKLDRSQGDVHASGNPHINTDPRRIAIVAEKLTQRLQALDSANAVYYRERWQQFSERWQRAIKDWSAKAAPLKGVRIVSHHRDMSYLENWLGLVNAGELEPKPGVPPTASHLAELKSALAHNPARMVIRTPYQDARASEWLMREANVHAVVLPFTIGGTPAATDLFTLFDDTVARLLEGIK